MEKIKKYLCELVWWITFKKVCLGWCQNKECIFRRLMKEDYDGKHNR